MDCIIFVFIFIILLILIIFMCKKIIVPKESLVLSILGSKIVIGGIVYNCAKYLDKVFNNIKTIISRFNTFQIVILIDQGTDNSLAVLEKWQRTLKNVIILKGNKSSPIRTKNIAIARNKVMAKLLELYKEKPYPYFIMMDMDDVSANKMNIDVFEEAWNRSDEWDSISFNRKPYYDVWALSHDPFIISAFHWKENGVKKMKDAIEKRLEKWPEDKLYPVYSAFNGFAIYKSIPFVFLQYEWKFNKTLPFLTPTMKKLNEEAMYPNTLKPFYDPNSMDCEHRYFHFDAMFNYGSKIRIFPKVLFE